MTAAWSSRPTSLDNILAQLSGRPGMTQLHIAETQKYAHVTFFFNGGEEIPFPGEERILIPSPRGPDLRPEAGDERPAGHRLRRWTDPERQV